MTCWKFIKFPPYWNCGLQGLWISLKQTAPEVRIPQETWLLHSHVYVHAYYKQPDSARQLGSNHSGTSQQGLKKKQFYKNCTIHSTITIGGKKHCLHWSLKRYNHEQSLQEMLRKKGKATTTQQKGKATQHNSPETVIFQRKIGCLGWDSNPRPSALQATLLPTKPLRQLSWLGLNPVYKSHSISTWYTGELKLSI